MYAGGFKQVLYKEYICWIQVKIHISDQTSLRICNSVVCSWFNVVQLPAHGGGCKHHTPYSIDILPPPASHEYAHHHVMSSYTRLLLTIARAWNYTLLFSHGLNMEKDLQSLFGLRVNSCTHWHHKPPPPRIWAHIRGRYWSSKILPKWIFLFPCLKLLLGHSNRWTQCNHHESSCIVIYTIVYASADRAEKLLMVLLSPCILCGQDPGYSSMGRTLDIPLYVRVWYSPPQLPVSWQIQSQTPIIADNCPFLYIYTVKKGGLPFFYGVYTVHMGGGGGRGRGHSL